MHTATSRPCILSPGETLCVITYFAWLGISVASSLLRLICNASKQRRRHLIPLRFRYNLATKDSFYHAHFVEQTTEAMTDDDNGNHGD